MNTATKLTATFQSIYCYVSLSFCTHTHTGTLKHYYSLIHVHTLNSIFVYTSWYMPEFIH